MNGHRTAQPEQYGLYEAKVWEIHPEDNAVDVTLLHDSRVLVGVPLLSLSMSGNTGLVDQCRPTLTTSGDDKWKSLNTDERDIVAIIGFVNGGPVCLGFKSPPVCQMNFEEPLGFERRLARHASDVYNTLDRDGNYEWYHPSGTMLIVGEDKEHLDLTSKDYDKVWKIEKNLTRAPWVRLRVCNAGTQKTDITISPEGEVTLTTVGDINVHTDANIAVDADGDISIAAEGDISVDAGGDVSVTAGGSVTVEAGADVTVTAPEVLLDTPMVTLTGQALVGGHLTVMGNIYHKLAIIPI